MESTIYDKVAEQLKPPAQYFDKVVAAVEGLTPAEQDAIFNAAATGQAYRQVAGMDLSATSLAEVQNILRGIARNNRPTFNTARFVDGLFTPELRELAQEAISSLSIDARRHLKVEFVPGEELPEGKWFEATGSQIRYDRQALEESREDRRFAVEVKTQIQAALRQVVAAA